MFETECFLKVVQLLQLYPLYVTSEKNDMNIFKWLSKLPLAALFSALKKN
jgi:hypothetical protein